MKMIKALISSTYFLLEELLVILWWAGWMLVVLLCSPGRRGTTSKQVNGENECMVVTLCEIISLLCIYILHVTIPFSKFLLKNKGFLIKIKDIPKNYVKRIENDNICVELFFSLILHHGPFVLGFQLTNEPQGRVLITGRSRTYLFIHWNGLEIYYSLITSSVNLYSTSLPRAYSFPLPSRQSWTMREIVKGHSEDVA